MEMTYNEIGAFQIIRYVEVFVVSRFVISRFKCNS